MPSRLRFKVSHRTLKPKKKIEKLPAEERERVPPPKKSKGKRK